MSPKVKDITANTVRSWQVQGQPQLLRGCLSAPKGESTGPRAVDWLCCSPDLLSGSIMSLCGAPNVLGSVGPLLFPLPILSLTMKSLPQPSVPYLQLPTRHFSIFACKTELPAASLSPPPPPSRCPMYTLQLFVRHKT